MAKVKDIRKFDSVTVELGGKVRKIQFDLNAFAELENRYGTVQNAMEQLQKGRIIDIRTILWAGLIHEEVILDEITGEPKGYNITPYQVGSWIKNPQMLQEVSMKLAQAIGQDMPNPEDMVQAQQQEQSAAVTPAGVQIAKVVLTPEEEAEQAKND